MVRGAGVTHAWTIRMTSLLAMCYINVGHTEGAATLVFMYHIAPLSVCNGPQETLKRLVTVQPACVCAHIGQHCGPSWDTQERPILIQEVATWQIYAHTKAMDLCTGLWLMLEVLESQMLWRVNERLTFWLPGDGKVSIWCLRESAWASSGKQSNRASSYQS